MLFRLHVYTLGMRIESPAFTEREMRGFLDEVSDHERQRLIGRLQAASARLAILVNEGLGRQSNRPEAWTGHDVLAHIAVLSKFYGMLTYQVGSGKVTQVELLEHVQARDVAGEQLSALSDRELLSIAQQDHQRTIAFLQSADAAAMRRQATLYEGFSMSALELALLGLCSHLEIHLDQLQRARQP
jgi:hypothetical protein